MADLGIGGCAATPLPYTNGVLWHGEDSLLPIAGGGLERARDARPGMGEAILRVPQLAAWRVRRGLGWVGAKKQWIHVRGLGWGGGAGTVGAALRRRPWQRSDRTGAERR